MGGSSKTTVNKTEKKDPWAPAMPALNTALTGAVNAYNTTYQGPQVAALDPNVTAGQNDILRNADAGMISGLAGLSGGNLAAVLGNGGLAQGASGAMSGIGSALGQFNDTLGQAQGYLTPYASGAMRENNPYLDRAIANAMSGASEAVNRQFSASGRYGSGAHSGALGTALGRIETDARMNAYNQDTQNQLASIQALGNLASSGLQGNVTGQGAITNIGQQGFSNVLNGLNSLGTLNQAQNADAASKAGVGGQRMDYQQALIDAENNAPWQRVNNLANVAGSIGSLGGTVNTTGVTKTTQDPGLAGLFGGIAAGFGGLANFNKAGGFKELFNWSDERLKENIEEVGKLHDGQKVFAYNYKGDPKPQIGLLAQEVEKTNPEAVMTDPSGFKKVHYGMATAKAAKKGGK